MVSFITHTSITRMLGAAVRGTPFPTSALSKAVASRSLPKAGYSNSLEYVPPFFHKGSSDFHKMGMFPVLLGIIVARSEDSKAEIRAKMQVLQDRIDALSKILFSKRAQLPLLWKRMHQLLAQQLTDKELAFCNEHQRKWAIYRSWTTSILTNPADILLYDTVMEERPRYLALNARQKKVWDEIKAEEVNIARSPLLNEILGLENQLSSLLEDANKLEVAIYGTGGFFKNSSTAIAYKLILANLTAQFCLTFPQAAPSIGSALTIARILQLAVEAQPIGQPKLSAAQEFLNFLQPYLLKTSVSTQIAVPIVAKVVSDRLSATIGVLKTL